jgi:signal transduction histidine kinase
VIERLRVTRLEAVLGGTAIVLAVAAFWLTLAANFLAHPGWLAVQKADVIAGPVLVGLYWRRRRPRSRFGPLLIVAGFLHAPYILQSSAEAWAFAFGVAWESVIYVVTLAVILAFPTGKLDGVVERVLVASAAIGVTALSIVSLTLSPTIAPVGTISVCEPACPENGWLITADAGLAAALSDARALLMVAIAIAAVALIIWRFMACTPPRRRALVIGTPIALVFLVTQIARQLAAALDVDSGSLYAAITWTSVASRAALWYGFLLALVAAELFAARVLRRIVMASLDRPPLRELEGMLREPLGDPGLRLAFTAGSGWVDVDGAALRPDRGRVLTEVEHEGRAPVAVIHDSQLAEDPELIQAAGAVAMLAKENAELETGWNDSLRQLRQSRARIAVIGDTERRELERDLHDGAQQQLTALLMKLSLTRETLGVDSAAQDQLRELEAELEDALEELRRLAHGIYPAPLAESGLVRALEVVAMRSGGRVVVSGDGVGRYPPEVEGAVYFCCLEAVHNATKHAGPDAQVSISLRVSDSELRFDVRDDGDGFDPVALTDGVGLRNMRARLDAFDGRLAIDSAPGRGTAVSGAVPVA